MSPYALLVALGLVLVVAAHRSVPAAAGPTSAGGVGPPTVDPHAAAVLRYGRAERAVLYFNQSQRVARVAVARYQDDHEHSLARLGDLFVEFASIATAVAPARLPMTGAILQAFDKAIDQADDGQLKAQLAHAQDLARTAVAEAAAANVRTLGEAQDLLKAMVAQYGAALEQEWLKLAPGVPVAKG